MERSKRERTCEHDNMVFHTDIVFSSDRFHTNRFRNKDRASAIPKWTGSVFPDDCISSDRGDGFQSVTHRCSFVPYLFVSCIMETFLQIFVESCKISPHHGL